MKKRITLSSVLILALTVLASWTLSSCGDNLDDIRKEYTNKPKDPRLVGYWRVVIPAYDNEPDLNKRPKNIDTTALEITSYTTDGKILKYSRRTVINGETERLYYTEENKRMKTLEVSSWKKRGGYLKDEIEYTIHSGRLTTPYGEFIRTTLITGKEE